MKDEIIEVSGQRWKVRNALSADAALNAIADARATGSVGAKHIRDETAIGGDVVVMADVVKVNSDGTECKLYSMPY